MLLHDLQSFHFVFKSTISKICNFCSRRVFTPEISSRDETGPGMKSSLSMVKFLLPFTRFCRGEISSQNELIPVKKTGMKFHPG